MPNNDDDDPGLTEEAYAANLKILGLRPTGATTGRTSFYLTRENELVGVPNANWQTSEQRRETIERLKYQLGVGIFPGPPMQ